MGKIELKLDRKQQLIHPCTRLMSHFLCAQAVIPAESMNVLEVCFYNDYY